MEFKIIGCATGSESVLTDEAKEAVLKCDKIFSTERISSVFKSIRDDIEIVPYSEIFDLAVSCGCNSVGILVSGDVGFFSAAKGLRSRLEKYGGVKLICGISSMQYFCSKIGISYEDCVFLSAHGRKTEITGPVSYNKKVFVLTGGKNCRKILNELDGFDMGFLYVYIGENLSMKNEKITQGIVSRLKDKDYDELSVMLIVNDNAADKNIMLSDKDFIRGGEPIIPMTKEEIRWITVSKMNIKSYFICYDIGSGTGSVSIEMAKKADMGMVYSVDKNIEAVSLLKKNIKKTGCYNIKAYGGDALTVMKSLPPPDAVFIGGGGRDIKEIIKTAFDKNSNAVIVVNAVSIETASRASECFDELKIKNKEIMTVNVSKGRSIGGLTIMKANNPITIISGGGLNDA